MKNLINWILVGVFAVVGITIIVKAGDIRQSLEDKLVETIAQESGLAQEVEKEAKRIRIYETEEDFYEKLRYLEKDEIDEFLANYCEIIRELEDCGIDVTSEAIDLLAMEAALNR